MMKTLCIVLVLYMLCDIATGRPGPGGNHTTCTTSGVVLEDSAAQVTCNFHGKVEGIFYADKTSTKEAVIIAVCSWRGENPDCRLTHDFLLKEATPDGRMTFQVPSVKQKHSGHYRCKTLPAEESIAEPCTLTVQKNEIIGSNSVTCHTNSPVQLGEDASIFCMFTKTVGITGVTLEKFNPENNQKEEIVHCGKDAECIVRKEGYLVDQKTDSYLRASIAGTTVDKATGLYVCRSTLIQQESGTCALALTSGEKERRVSTVKQILYPMYAILGCFLLLIVLTVVAFFQRYSFFSSRRSPVKEKKNSQELLMGDAKKPEACEWKP